MLNRDGGSEAYQDGPHVVAWWDIPHPLDRLWKWKLGTNHVALITPAGESLVLRLGLDLAWQSEYSLKIDIVDEECSFHRAPTSTTEDLAKMRQFTRSHGCINLTIPGHVKRTLQLQGYDVLFLAEDDPNHPSLRLTNANLHFAITIDYSHELSSTADEGSQTLKLRARVKMTSSVYNNERADQDLCPVVVWKDTNGYGWDLHLDHKEVPFTSPTGGELTLRLGFTFMWYSEYCLDVEVKTHPRELPEPRPAEDISAVETGDTTEATGNILVQPGATDDRVKAPPYRAVGDDAGKKDHQRPGAIVALVLSLKAKLRRWRGGGESSSAAPSRGYGRLQLGG